MMRNQRTQISQKRHLLQKTIKQLIIIKKIYTKLSTYVCPDPNRYLRLYDRCTPSPADTAVERRQHRSRYVSTV